MLEEGGVTITYHPVSILDRLSAGSSYSTRAVNATAIVADKSPEHFTAFVTAMYEDQPAEGTSGRSDAEIAQIAQDVGVPAEVTDTFTDTVDGTFDTRGRGATSNGHVADVRPVERRGDQPGGHRRARVLDAHRAHQRRALHRTGREPGALKQAVDAAKS